MYALANMRKRHMLRVRLVDVSGKVGFAFYDGFKIGHSVRN